MEALTTRIETLCRNDLHIVTLHRPTHREFFVTAKGRPFSELAAWLRAEDARVLSMEILGISYRDADIRRAFDDAFGPPSWPLLWSDDGCDTSTVLGGIQVWAVAGLPVKPLQHNGIVLGMLFEDDDARYCRLSGLAPADPADSLASQATQVFQTLNEALSVADMDFSHVIRTWFYNRNIVSWYNEFNGVRDHFFREMRVFDRLVPASTGVGGHNIVGAALMAGALAIQTKTDAVRAFAVPSPLQCPALEYGSSFSRAVELAYPDHRRLFISGTASICPDGKTVHLGDVDGQVERTMDVVEAILDSRGMTWADTTRAIAYFKFAADAPAFTRYAERYNLSKFPVLTMPNDICRDDLLFELELDAVTTSREAG